ncbi:hypothetical protein [Burkholderia stagnalis]|uniref:hypothetical protein n=1 Tax=Burkholderia stagnalis TaxID=1503054 RepID=UPI000F5781E2|nr:hypothetical protein [Burkholderia stagnalis]
MSLRNRFLDAIIDGRIGNGITVSRQEFMEFFLHENPATTGCFLSNSEIETGSQHSPNYTHFTLRISEGKYLIHPDAIKIRMTERGII